MEVCMNECVNVCLKCGNVECQFSTVHAIAIHTKINEDKLLL